MSRPYPWTKRQRQIVAHRYGKDTLAVVARKVGIPKGPVWKEALRQGLTKRRPKKPGLERLVREKHPLGWPDAKIAREWNRRHPAAVVERHTVGRIRKRLGLPCVGWSAVRMRQHKRDVRAWMERNGYTSMGDIRAQAFKRFVASRGWPDHLAPRHVQILDYLWEHGPATRWEIAAAIGMSTARGQRRLLSYNTRSRKKTTRGSYIADLLYEGLVERSQTRMAVSGPTKYHRVHLYWIAPGVERKEIKAG